MDAAGVALQRPIGHRLFDEARIGHQDIDVVVGADAGRARADLHDGAANADVLDLDIVADRHHPVEDQEQPDTNSLTTPCRPRPTPMPRAPAKTARGRQVQPRRRQGRHRSDHDDAVAGQPLQQIDGLAAAVRPLAHPAQGSRHQPVGGEGDHNDDARADQSAQRQVRPGDAGDLRLLDGGQVQFWIGRVIGLYSASETVKVPVRRAQSDFKSDAEILFPEPAVQPGHDPLGGVFGRHGGGVHHDLGRLGRFIGAVDAGEVLQLARARLPVEPLDVAGLGDGQGGVDVHLHELALAQQVARPCGVRRGRGR